MPDFAIKGYELLTAATRMDLVVHPGRWRVSDLYETVTDQEAAFAARREALDWGRSEWPVLTVVVFRAHVRGSFDLSWQMAEALWGLILYTKPREWLGVYEAGAASARKGSVPLALPRMLLGQSSALQHAGRADEAIDLAEESLGRARDLGHPLSEAAALAALGGLYLRDQQGKGSAAELFEAARDIHRSEGRPRGVALMTRYLGETALKLGRADEAADRFTEALGLFAAEGDDYNTARVKTLLGQMHLAGSRPDEARTLLGEALVVASGIGAVHQAATIRVGLADVCEATGETAGAAEHLEAALSGLSEMGSAKADAVAARLERLRAA
ncbi:Tetratricopeptide repeat-containing protein [Sinosporangium album]|uniref:Tetratricopeptide repeat-containing protein n=1 Tax=Sinosporangium album TaxID=504805 RepID=A0A1G8HQD3_9ACTN|nr:tetratricopeptide repeat protein [Sinosporangium album]SDI08896.1 Tetratricopeptide repeat-containing protein [Sinosporangium album]